MGRRMLWTTNTVQYIHCKSMKIKSMMLHKMIVRHSVVLHEISTASLIFL